MIERKSRNAEGLEAVTHTHIILTKINKNYTTKRSAVLFSILKNIYKHRLFGYVHFYAYS